MSDTDDDRPDGDAASGGEDDEAHGGQGSEEEGPKKDAQIGAGEPPPSGGYKNHLDPAEDMPVVPTSPETWDNASDKD